MLRPAFIALVAAGALSACAHVPPPPSAEELARYEKVSQNELMATTLKHDWHLPNSVIGDLIRAGQLEVRGMFRVCVERGGRVVFTEPLATGSAGKEADEAFMKRIRQWTFQPAPVDRCGPLNVRFNVTVSAWSRNYQGSRHGNLTVY
jgi:hypothetical protein